MVLAERFPRAGAFPPVGFAQRPCAQDPSVERARRFEENFS
jgi:hypothetical protein